jgi:hypothetical protein
MQSRRHTDYGAWCISERCMRADSAVDNPGHAPFWRPEKVGNQVSTSFAPPLPPHSLEKAGNQVNTSFSASPRQYFLHKLFGFVVRWRQHMRPREEA